MRLRYRFALVSLGVIIFLIVTPILVLYARGFKIDWKKHLLYKTGAMVIKTQPTKAAVFLNDKKQDDVTPASLRFLTPSDYNLRVEKEGYQPWTKRLSVKSELVTWANFNRDFLTLFYSQPKQEQTWQANAVSLSKSFDEIAIIKDGQLETISVNDGNIANSINLKDIKLPLLPKNITLDWQNSQQILSLFNSTTKWNISANQIALIKKIETNGQTIALTLDSDLYIFNAGSLNLLDRGISNFNVADDGIWYIQKNLLKRYNASSGNSETIANFLPTTKQSQIIRANNQIYLILDGTLYLVNGNLEKISAPVTFASWNQDSSQLLYGNDNEISTYDPNSKTSDLILRSITNVNNPKLNSETGYVFFQNEGKIKAVELDSRDHRNIFTIADALDDFTLSKDGKKLYTFNQSQINYYTIR